MNSKKALLVGINYIGTSSELGGCINDVKNMKSELLSRGYLPENILELTDETDMKPTRENILRELLTLILSNSKYLFFHYSGHGSSVTDLNGDEEDGKDECLVPIDCSQSGFILDDELRGILTCLRKDQLLTCVLDCCHSGSGMDLKYNLYERFGYSTLQMKDDGRYSPTVGQCIVFSGCADSQYSADAWIDGKAQGAMTYSFLRSIRETARTYEELVRSLKCILKEGGYSQVPMFSSGKPLNLKSKIIF